MSKLNKYRSWVISGFLVILVVASLILYLFLSKPLVPAPIKKQVSYLVIVPGSDNKISKNSFNYDSNQKILTFTAYPIGSQNKLTITEEAEPDNFVDVPQVYTALINKLNGYATLDTAIGRVDLTKPKELNGLQTAIAISQGTLIFVRPTQNLSKDDWRLFFNSFYTIK